MELKILWLYHDIKDVFGDMGNLQVLKKRCHMRGIDCFITTCGIKEEADMSMYDLVYFGTNITGKDAYVLEDLKQRKDGIVQALNSGVFFLLICGGFQAFGKHYLYEDETIDALGVFSYQSDYRIKTPCIGNVWVSSSFVAQEIIGFENHPYRISGITDPLGKVLLGKGNGDGMAEGYVQEHVLGTNLHGPLLPKNPTLADKIIELALRCRYGDVVLRPLEDRYEQKAREALKKRFKIA